MKVINHINGDPHDNALVNLEELETLQWCRCGFQAHLLAERTAEPKGFMVLCDHCWRRGPLAPTKWLAIRLWNNDHRGTQS